MSVAHYSHLLPEEEKKVVLALKTLRNPKKTGVKRNVKSREGQWGYNKLNGNCLLHLSRFYSKNKYPSKGEMWEIAKEFNEKITKIDNWFKHKRRSEVKKGVMKFEKKKVFSYDETGYLMNLFLKNKRPNLEKYKEMAKTLNCEEKNVRNWFNYKRKLVVKIDNFRKNKLIEFKPNTLCQTPLKPPEIPHQFPEIPIKIIEITTKIEETPLKLPIILQKNQENTSFSYKIPSAKLEEGIKLIREFTEKPREIWFKDGGLKEVTKTLANINQNIYEYYLFQQQVNLFSFLTKETLGAKKLKN